MSSFVVHFTKGGPNENDYNSIMSICYNCILTPSSTFGIGKRFAPLVSTQETVCFSEIPPGQWDRLLDRRGTKYGLAFTKEFIISRGGGPIWYAWKDTPHWRALQEMMSAGAGNSNDPIWRITPMIDAPGIYGERRYYFDWEREWRHVGSLSFDPNDVAFLLIPEELHSVARSFFDDAFHYNEGPAYFCPFVDPTWGRNKILRTLVTYNNHRNRGLL